MWGGVRPGEVTGACLPFEIRTQPSKILPSCSASDFLSLTEFKFRVSGLMGLFLCGSATSKVTTCLRSEDLADCILLLSPAVSFESLETDRGEELHSSMEEEKPDMGPSVR